MIYSEEEEYFEQINSQEEEYKFCDDPQKERYFTRHQSEVFSKQLENERTNPSSVESNKNQMSTTPSLKQKSISKRRRIQFEEKEDCSDHPENCQCAIDPREEYGYKNDYVFDPKLQPTKTNLKKKSKYGKFIVENVHPSFIHDTDGRIDFDSFGEKQINPFYSAEEIDFTYPFPDLILEQDDLEENLEQQSRTDRGDIQEKICLETENVSQNDDEIPSSNMRYNLRNRLYPDYSEKRPYKKFARGKTSLNSQSASNKSHTNSVENVLPSNCLKAEGKNEKEARPIYLTDSDRFYL
jgi:hypothetical protein